MQERSHGLDEFRGGHGCSRLLLAAYLAVGAVGGLYGGYTLAHEVRHWLAWAFAFVVLEPIGITCLFALAALIAPNSIAAELLRWSAPRAKRAAIIVGVLYVGLVVGLFGFVLFEWARG